MIGTLRAWSSGPGTPWRCVRPHDARPAEYLINPMGSVDFLGEVVTMQPVIMTGCCPAPLDVRHGGSAHAREGCQQARRGVHGGQASRRSLACLKRSWKVVSPSQPVSMVGRVSLWAGNHPVGNTAAAPWITASTMFRGKWPSDRCQLKAGWRMPSHSGPPSLSRRQRL